MTRRPSAFLVWLGVAVGAAQPQGAAADKHDSAKPRVELQRAVLENGRVRVDFQVENAFAPETLELIRSGIAVKFRHRVEVRTARKFWLSPHKVLARVVIETGVEFDALTGNYELSRVTALKEPNRAKAPPPRSETRVTDDTDEMVRWMTHGQHIEIYDPAGELPDDEDLLVAVESSIGRRYILLFFPAREYVDVVGPVSD